MARVPKTIPIPQALAKLSKQAEEVGAANLGDLEGFANEMSEEVSQIREVRASILTLLIEASLHLCNTEAILGKYLCGWRYTRAIFGATLHRVLTLDEGAVFGSSQWVASCTQHRKVGETSALSFDDKWGFSTLRFYCSLGRRHRNWYLAGRSEQCTVCYKDIRSVVDIFWSVKNVERFGSWVKLFFFQRNTGYWQHLSFLNGHTALFELATAPTNTVP